MLHDMVSPQRAVPLGGSLLRHPAPLHAHQRMPSSSAISIPSAPSVGPRSRPNSSTPTLAGDRHHYGHRQRHIEPYHDIIDSAGQLDSRCSSAVDFRPSPAPSEAVLSSTFTSNADEFLRKYRVREAPPVEPSPADVVGNYRLGKLLGVGGYSQVFEGESMVGRTRHVAIKVISRIDCDEETLQAVHDETEIWSGLDHPHILDLIEVIETPAAICIVSDLAAEGSLLRYTTSKTDGRLSEREACRIFLELCEAVNYCHSHGIIHGDVKLDNILLDDEFSVKLADFGLSAAPAESPSPLNLSDNELESSSLPSTLPMMSNGFAESLSPPPSSFPRRKSVVVGAQDGASLSNEPHCGGTLLYCAPEMLRSGTSTYSSDVWAIGVCLYAMLCGNFPFDDDYAPRLQMLIMRGRFAIPDDISDSAQRLLAGLLDPEPSRRPALNTISQHEWCRTYGPQD